MELFTAHSLRLMILEILFILGAYLVGSISAAIITCKLLGLPDPRTQGSNNPGATNVLRIGGKKAAAITLVGDMLKGLVPLLIGKFIGLDPTTQAAIGVAAFLGHLYPIFFGFQGGKGVATTMGVLVALSWPVGLSVICTWLFIAYGLKISSLAALVSILLAPVYMYLLESNLHWLYATIFLSALLIWRHRSNIKQLLQGTESKIGKP